MKGGRCRGRREVKGGSQRSWWNEGREVQGQEGGVGRVTEEPVEY